MRGLFLLLIIFFSLSSTNVFAQDEERKLKIEIERLDRNIRMLESEKSILFNKRDKIIYITRLKEISQNLKNLLPLKNTEFRPMKMEQLVKFNHRTEEMIENNEELSDAELEEINVAICQLGQLGLGDCEEVNLTIRLKNNSNPNIRVYLYTFRDCITEMSNTEVGVYEQTTCPGRYCVVVQDASTNVFLACLEVVVKKECIDKGWFWCKIWEYNIEKSIDMNIGCDGCVDYL